ncbi:hypothetical protein [Nocardia brasiliensis]|uniref:hypothetical protein n=1 Tax=Nocardia brasiliensis TaxID=37326 RepID=UPI0004A6F4EF|nr:hypothetical protein [Nocardia brasiliensis]
MIIETIAASDTVRNTAAAVTIALGTFITIALAAWGWHEWRTERRPQMFVLIVGAVIGWLNDPAFQTLANIEVGAPTGISPGIFGYLATAEEPLWCVFTYPMWVCFVSYVAFYAMKEQWPRIRLWLLFGVTSLIDALAELPYIHTGLYSYKAGQALRVFDFPIAWAPTYMSMAILLGTLLYLLDQRISGWQWLLTVPLVGSGYLALTFVAGWPLVIGTHTNPGEPWITLWALLAIGTEIAMVYLLSMFLPKAAATRGASVPVE